MNNQKPLVIIVMGSTSDMKYMQTSADALEHLNIPHEMKVLSAHRTPYEVAELASNAERDGVQAIIAGAGYSAHLAGVIAAHTIVPVCGVPLPTSPFQGFDSLLSTVQMPPGIPVATFGAGESGAKNAALFVAAQMARSNPDLADALHQFRSEMREKILNQ